MRRRKAKPQTIEAALLESARTVAEHLRKKPRDARARWLASLLRELCEGIAEASALSLPLPSMPLRAPRAADRARLRGVVCTIWRDFVRHRGLTARRAAILAARIARVAEPAVCVVLAHEARTLDCVDAATILERNHAAFMARANNMKIDRALLDVLGLDVTRAALRVRWHPDGHLAALERGQRKLSLAARPGSGRYVEEGKRGGYGYAMDERYERGAARGTFFSPWHDGEEYAHEQPWIAWVTSCAATVLA